MEREGSPIGQEGAHPSATGQWFNKSVGKTRENYNEENIRGTEQLYPRLRSVYRASHDVLTQVTDVMTQNGRTYATVPIELTAVLPVVRQGCHRVKNVRIITKDSGLRVYEDSTSIILPVDKQLKTLKKTRPYRSTPTPHLGLPSSRCINRQWFYRWRSFLRLDVQCWHCFDV